MDGTPLTGLPNTRLEENPTDVFVEPPKDIEIKSLNYLHTLIFRKVLQK